MMNTNWWILHTIPFVYLSMLLRKPKHYIKKTKGKYFKLCPCKWHLIWNNRLDQIGKGVCQGCTLSPCLFNVYSEYIMQNARLGEAQAEIKTTGTNINNLKYADDNTLMAESEDELRSLLMEVKEESEKVGLKLKNQKLRSWNPVPSLYNK